MARRIRTLVLLALAGLLAGPSARAADPTLPAFVRMFGSSGTGDGQLDLPLGVDVDAAGNFYVADHLNDRIQVFEPDGTFADTIGSSGTGAGQFDGPNGIEAFFDPEVREERLLVADSLNGRIQLLELDGTHVKTVTSFAGLEPSMMNQPADIARADDGRVAVADRLQERVLLLDASLDLERAIELDSNPTGVAFSPDGTRVHVVLHEVGVATFDAENGADLGGFTLPAGISSPYHLAVDEIGFLYLTHSTSASVVKLSRAGTEQWRFGTFGDAEGRLKQPEAAVPLPGGLLAVTEAGNDRVSVFDLCPGGFPDVPEHHQFWFEICWMDTEGVSTGYEDGTFRPTDVVSRQAMAAFIQRASGEALPDAGQTQTFSDVPPTHPFHDEIEWMAAEGIAGGYDDGTFRPTAPVSRQAMSAFMVRAAGDETWPVPGSPTFSDVPTGHTFYDEIEWMAWSGVSTGYNDGTYRPTEKVSRQAMAAFLARLALVT